jgi:hypothetical protein
LEQCVIQFSACSPLRIIRGVLEAAAADDVRNDPT